MNPRTIRSIRCAHHRARLWLAPLLLCSPLASGALDGAITDPESIRAAARSAVLSHAGGIGATVYAEVNSLDPRLRLAACSAPLVAFITGDGQLRDQTTVGVRCEAPVHWTVYTAVRLESELPVLIARRALARDAVPTEADFAVSTRRMPGISSHYVSDAARLAGQRLRRPLALGETLTADALQTAAVIHYGQEVTLFARVGGTEVRAKAVALSDGRPDDRIKVRNVSSQRIVEGLVRSAGVVEVVL